MISQITGTVVNKYGSSVVIDAAGVGYEIELTLGMMFSLPEKGSQITICTHFVVREDVMLLFGFQTISERALFRQLIKISGIGPKVAIGILSSVSPSHLVSAVKSSNSSMLTQLPGIGKKTAERLVIELRDKLDDWIDEDWSDDGDKKSLNNSTQLPNQSMLQKESVAALVALGYKTNEASSLVAKVINANASAIQQLTVQEVIRQSLRLAVKL